MIEKLNKIEEAFLGLAPFGRRIDSQGAIEGPLSLIMNILWWVFGGLEVATTHLVFAAILAITIIGLPFAKQHMKLLQVAVLPFGARVE